MGQGAEPQEEQQTIEGIIAAHDARYRTIKQDAEFHDYRWALTFSEKDDAQKAEGLAQWEAGTAEHVEVFSAAEYYATAIAPRIRELTQDAAEFERVSALSLSALERMGKYILCEGVDRKPPIVSFFEQFFAGLHQEGSETITAFAAVEVSRMQGWMPMHESTGMDFNEWIAAYRASPFAEHLPEIIEIGEGFHPDAIITVPFWRQSLPTLEQLSARGHAALIPTYLALAHATVRKTGKFRIDRTDTVDRIIALRECGEHLDAGIRLYDALVDNLLSESSKDVEYIVGEIRAFAIRRSGAEIATLLGEATALANAKVNPLPYLKAIHGDAAYADRAHIRETAQLLGAASPRAAQRYLEAIPEIFKLPSTLRQDYEAQGTLLVGEFKEEAPQYFSAAVQVLKAAPEQFLQWVNTIRTFGARNPPHFGSFATVSAQSLDLCDALLDAAVEFTEQTGVPSWKIEGSSLRCSDEESISEDITTREHDGAYRVWFDGITGALRAGMSSAVFTEILTKLKEKKLIGYHEHVFAGMHAGIDPHRYITVLPDLVRYGMLDIPLAKIGTMIAADIPLEQKGELLREYGMASDALDDLPALDLAGGWKEGLEDRLHATIAEGLDIATSGMQFSELLRLAATDHEKVPRQKLVYIVGKTLHGAPIAKNFPFGKTYGELQVNAARELQDPIALTNNLITALTSRDAERRGAAAVNFDPDMLAGINAGVEAKVVYDLVREELPQLRDGSRLAAERILEALTEQYPRCEPLADTAIAIDSLFDEAVPFSALTLRMQRGIFADLFDDRKLLCCAFLPNGGSHWGAYNYLLDENIGLLQLIPKNGNGEKAAHEPIGVAICVNTVHPETGERYLLIDSVEAGANIDIVREKQWIPFVHAGICELGRDQGAVAVVYNRKTHGVKPLKVLKYLERMYAPEQRGTYAYEQRDIDLVKPASVTIKRFAARAEREYHKRMEWYAAEVAGGRGEGTRASVLREELEDCNARVMRCYATFLEAFGKHGFRNDPKDRPYLRGEHRLPSVEIGGKVEGLIFSLH